MWPDVVRFRRVLPFWPLSSLALSWFLSFAVLCCPSGWLRFRRVASLSMGLSLLVMFTTFWLWFRRVPVCGSFLDYISMHVFIGPFLECGWPLSFCITSEMSRGTE